MTNLTAMVYIIWLEEKGFLVRLKREGWRDDCVATNMGAVEVPRGAAPLFRLRDDIAKGFIQ